MKKDQIRVKRVYDKPADSDGYRVLVDRLWPRGIRKADLKHDLWLKDVSPSSELRKWFNHDADQWGEFKKRYHAELNKEKDAVAQLLDIASSETLTLLYAAKDEEHNQAVVLRDYLIALANKKDQAKD